PTLAFLPSGLLTLASRHGVHVINCADQSRTAAAPQSEGADCHAVSPDGRWLATAHAPLQDTGSHSDLTLRVYDLGACQRRCCHGLVGPYCSGVAFSPDGTRIALTSGPRLLIWPLEGDAPEVVREIDRSHYFTSVAFTPSGRHLAVCRNDRTL